MQVIGRCHKSVIHTTIIQANTVVMVVWNEIKNCLGSRRELYALGDRISLGTTERYAQRKVRKIYSICIEICLKAVWRRNLLPILLFFSCVRLHIVLDQG